MIVLSASSTRGRLGIPEGDAFSKYTAVHRSDLGDYTFAKNIWIRLGVLMLKCGVDELKSIGG